MVATRAAGPAPEGARPGATIPGRRSGWPPWAPWALVGLLVAVRVVAIVAMLSGGIAEETSVLGGDARRYQEYFEASGTPYRDFAVEYPPLTLAFTALLQWPGPWGTSALLAVSQLGLELLVAAVLARTWGRRAGVAYLVLGTPMVAFPFPYARIDLLSVALAVVGVALARRDRPLTGGAALAAAAFAKVWPVVLVPALVVRRQWRALAAWAVVGAGGLVAWLVWSGPEGVRQVLTFRGASGWQIESIPGAIIHTADPASSRVEQGAWRTAVAVPGWSKVVMGVAVVAVVAVAWRAAARSSPSARSLAVDAYAPLAAVTALVVLGPILSPQYVLWLVPFAAIAAAAGDRVVGGLALATTALTTFLLASIHAQVEGARWATLPILARNALLLVLLAVALARLRAGRAERTRGGSRGALH